MLQTKNVKHQAFTFKHFSRKGYALFNCIGREVRIGCLAACTIACAYNTALATTPDTLKTFREIPGEDKTLDEAEVTGLRVPLSLEEAAIKVDILTREEIQAAKVQTINDLLKLCLSVDVRQRGSFGVQTDISVGGGTFDQIALLLNGVSLTNPQTGHLSADFPVAIADIERIEIYDEGASRAFGSQALNGAINIITKCDHINQTGLHLEGGSFGTLGGGAYLNLATNHYKNRISGDVLRSDGGTQNSSFQKYRTFYQGNYSDHMVNLSWQGGYSKQRYGANTFYSALYPSQWEEGTRYMAAVKAQTKGHIRIAPTFSWVRTFDHFQLIRHSNAGENFHRNDVFTAGLNAFSEWALGRTAIGAELRHEGIVSTNLGKPLTENEYIRIEGKDGHYNHRDNRTNISLFLEHHLVKRYYSLGAGIMVNRNTALNEKFYFYPGVDASFRPTRTLRIFTSWNKSLRLPTFTDLYYKSPTQQGNIGLKPEKASTFKIGTEWKRGAWQATLTGTYRHGTDMIDWVMFSKDDIYHATNFKIDNYGLQAQAKFDFEQLWGDNQPLKSISAGYMYNYQQRHDRLEIFKSNYALDYLRHKLLIALNHRVWNALEASWNLRWQRRIGSWLGYDENRQPQLHNYHPYALLSLKLSWSKNNYDLYANFDNLTAHRYYDLGAVRQPGMWFIVGGNIRFNL